MFNATQFTCFVNTKRADNVIAQLPEVVFKKHCTGWTVTSKMWRKYFLNLTLSVVFSWQCEEKFSVNFSAVHLFERQSNVRWSMSSNDNHMISIFIISCLQLPGLPRKLCFPLCQICLCFLHLQKSANIRIDHFIHINCHSCLFQLYWFLFVFMWVLFTVVQ